MPDIPINNESSKDQIIGLLANNQLTNDCHLIKKVQSFPENLIDGNCKRPRKCSGYITDGSGHTMNVEGFKNGYIKKKSVIQDQYEYIVSSTEEMTLLFVGEASIPTKKGSFRIRAYRDSSNNTEPLALISGDLQDIQNFNVPVRVHDQCFTSEVFGSLRCDCKCQLDFAMEYIQHKPYGMIIYSQQEGRGIGLANKIRAYSLQEHKGLDTIDANIELEFMEDQRQYKCVPHILRDCNISSIKLMTNNPRKLAALKKLDVEITERIPIIISPNPHSQRYLETKANRMGHILDGDPISIDEFKLTIINKIPEQTNPTNESSIKDNKKYKLDPRNISSSKNDNLSCPNNQTVYLQDHNKSNKNVTC